MAESQTQPKTEAVAPAKMTSAQAKKVKELPTVSARIRYLSEQGYSRSEITKLIKNAHGGDLRYQHVRNVLMTPLVGKTTPAKS